MIDHKDIIGEEIRNRIAQGRITLARNRTLKIYGELNCRSGRRMKIKNRVFFKTEAEALKCGYRPCGHCMPAAYKAWKFGSFIS